MSEQPPASLRPPPRVARGKYRYFYPWQGGFPAARGTNRLFCPWQLFFYRREQILVVLLPVSGFSIRRERETAFLLLESCQKSYGERDWETSGWHWDFFNTARCFPTAHFGRVGNNEPVPEVEERAILFPTESVFLIWERKTAQRRQT